MGPAVESGILRRGGLFERLAGAERVVHVSASPGSGKTVLLRSWLRDTGREPHAAWVSVPVDERDQQRFWTSVVLALRQTAAGAALVRPLLPSPDLDGWAMVEHLLEDLGGLDQPLWLVIDDVHELRSPEGAAQLELLLMRAPRTLRLVLATRRDLRLGLHRLRLEGEVTEVRAHHLRFSVDEARALLQSAGVELSDTALERLVNRCEGWAAGLRLAALSLRGHPDPERFAAEFSGNERTVAEYLLAEVLDHQPDPVRRLLLRTSVLDRVSGPLADLLTGESGGERTLHELEEANAFVVSLDASRSWFRYHRLFADLLQLELRRTEPDSENALREKAAAWYAEHGHPVEAVRQAQAARNWTLAARLLSDHWVPLLLDGYTATALSLADGMPAERAGQDADLAAVLANRVMHRSLQEAEPYITLAARGLDRVPAHRRAHVEHLLRLARLSMARLRGDVPGLVAEAELLLAPEAGDGVSSDLDMRLMALTSLGDAEVSTGRLDDAVQHLAAAVELARLGRRPMLELDGLAHWAMAASLRSPSTAAQLAPQAVELARQHGWDDHPAVSVAYLAQGMVSAWGGRLDEADHWLTHADRTLSPAAHVSVGALLNCGRGWLELARGRPGDAVAHFRTAARLGADLAAPYAAWAQCFSLQTYLHAGETDAVERALAAVDNGMLDSPGIRVVTAMLRLQQGDATAAAAAMAPVLDGSMAAGMPWDVEAFLVGAIAHEAAGDCDGAQRALESALDLAEPEGLLLPFLLHRSPRLLDHHAQHRTGHGGLVAEIRAALAASAPRPSAPADPLREPLSSGETRVLRYLPTNLSAPEIADAVYVSVNTVKTHMRHIYDKLGVHRRSEAVDRARALGLLAPSPARRA